MTKQEFLDELRLALTGRVSSSEVTDSVNYYEEFVATRVRSGQPEDEVLENLGDPRLIARSIIDVQKAAGQERSQKESYGEAYDTDEERQLPKKRIPGWLITIIIILVVIFVIGTIFSILSFLLPFIIPAVLILGFIRVIQRR